MYKNDFSGWIKLVFILVLLFFVSCVRKADKTEAEKYIKACDAELSLHARNISESSGFKELLSFYFLPESPLPFRLSNRVYEQGFTGYDLAKASGNYLFVNDSSHWIRDIAQADSLPLCLTRYNRKGEKIEFHLNAYDEEVSALQMVIPTFYLASIWRDGHELANFRYECTLLEGFPKAAWLKMKIADYHMQFELVSKFTSRSSADLDILLNILRENKPVVSISLSTKASFTENGTLTYSKIRGLARIFPLEIRLKSKNTGFPEGEHFIEDWNRSSSLNVYAQDGVFLGKIKLVRNREVDRLGLSMQYTDGSSDDLDKILLVVKEILNVKMHRFHP